MFAPLAEVLAAMGLGEPGVVRFLPDEIESLVALGEFQLAATLVDQLEERGRSLNRRSALATGRRCRALLLAAHGDVSGALVAIDEALRFHSGLGQPFELGRTLLTQGTLRRRAKQKRAAREALNQALSIFDSLGAPVWADRVRSEAARIGGRASSSVLTSTESRIADLAAAGHSNQEIANALFLSVITVEANLTRIYAKLGVRSRRELARYRHGVP
jgi:DNA-binding CsgD family transcriptional regulator